MRWEYREYIITADKSLLSVDRVKELLSDSYWANKRTKELIEKTIENSFCYGVYSEEEMIGFARVVTDYATMAWICDVMIDKGHRGKGLGKKLISCILETPELKNVRSALATKDAHGLYEQFGFERVESRFMVRKPAEST